MKRLCIKIWIHIMASLDTAYLIFRYGMDEAEHMVNEEPNHLKYKNDDWKRGIQWKV